MAVALVYRYAPDTNGTGAEQTRGSRATAAQTKLHRYLALCSLIKMSIPASANHRLISSGEVVVRWRDALNEILKKS